MLYDELIALGDIKFNRLFSTFVYNYVRYIYIYMLKNWHQGCHDMTCLGDVSVFGLRALEPLTNSDWLT